MKQKRYLYKIYNTLGQYVTTWDDVVNDPQFTANINGGAAEMVTRLARRVASFGEGQDVVLGYELRLYVFDDDAPAGVLIFSGYLSNYAPVIQATTEYIECHFLGFQSELVNYMITTTVSGMLTTTVPYNSYDPSDVLKAVIDAITPLGSRLGYTPATIEETGTVASYTFNTNTAAEGVQTSLELTPEGWYWYVDANKKMHLHPKAFSARHTFTIGKEIEEFTPEKRSESIINEVYFTGGGTPPLFSYTSDQNSIDMYGRHTSKYVDSRVTIQGSADIIVNKILTENRFPEIRMTIKIKDNSFDPENGYDIESIQVGDTCQIRNFLDSLASSKWDVALWDQSYWDNDVVSVTESVLQIVSVEYNPGYAIVVISSKLPQVSKRVEDVARNLVDSQTADNPAQPTT